MGKVSLRSILWILSRIGYSTACCSGTANLSSTCVTQGTTREQGSWHSHWCSACCPEHWEKGHLEFPEQWEEGHLEFPAVGRGLFGAGGMSKSEQKLSSKKPHTAAGQAYHFYNCLLEINLTWSHCSENKTRKKYKTKQLLKAFSAMRKFIFDETWRNSCYYILRQVKSGRKWTLLSRKWKWWEAAASWRLLALPGKFCGCCSSLQRGASVSL